MTEKLHMEISFWCPVTSDKFCYEVPVNMKYLRNYVCLWENISYFDYMGDFGLK